MDFNEDQEYQPIVDQDAQPEQPAQEPDSGAYRGAGAGQKESPYANSPYYSNYQPEQPVQPQQPIPEPQPRVKEKKERKPLGKGVKRTLAAVVALALVGGSCGITAWSVNRRWEAETQKLESDFAAQLEDLQDQLKEVAAITSGTSVSGSPVSSEGLSPSQVYAQNVSSVVAVSNYVSYSSGWHGTSSQLAGTGSGFIISEDGYILTNYHVVEDADAITVTTIDGEEMEATLVGYDEINDVALMKVEATGLNAVVIGSSDDLRVGDMVVAIGNPLGELTFTQTVGYVSGKDRSVTTDGTIINMLQTDVAINSGNSGGPLFNMKGEVVGITSAKYSGSTSSGASIEGIGFAIPIDDIKDMIDDFKDYGYLRNQAYLGVTVQNMDSSTANTYGLPVGSQVLSVVEGSCAEKAGIRSQDIIIAVGDYTEENNAGLTAALRRFSAGDTTTITVYRSGAEIELTITFDERPQDLDTTATDPNSGDMPDTGDYDEWFDYFYRYFGGNGSSQP